MSEEAWYKMLAVSVVLHIIVISLTFYLGYIMTFTF